MRKHKHIEKSIKHENWSKAENHIDLYDDDVTLIDFSVAHNVVEGFHELTDGVEEEYVKDDD